MTTFSPPFRAQNRLKNLTFGSWCVDRTGFSTGGAKNEFILYVRWGGEKCLWYLTFVTTTDYIKLIRLFFTENYLKFEDSFRHAFSTYQHWKYFLFVDLKNERKKFTCSAVFEWTYTHALNHPKPVTSVLICIYKSDVDIL